MKNTIKATVKQAVLNRTHHGRDSENWLYKRTIRQFTDYNVFITGDTVVGPVQPQADPHLQGGPQKSKPQTSVHIFAKY